MRGGPGYSTGLPPGQAVALVSCQAVALGSRSGYHRPRPGPAGHAALPETRKGRTGRLLRHPQRIHTAAAIAEFFTDGHIVKLGDESKPLRSGLLTLYPAPTLELCDLFRSALHHSAALML